MIEEIMSLALGNGLWAALFCLLFLYQLKDSRAREKKYSQTIESLSKSLNKVKNIKQDCEEILDTLGEVKEDCQVIKADSRAILSFAKKRRLVTDNYAKAEYIDFPKRTQKEIKCMDSDTLKDVYKAVQNYDDIRHVTALLTLIFTGIRRGELCSLRWESIDLDNRLMTIDLNVTSVIRVGVSYDAWGTLSEPNSSLLKANPFSYRGYYFDKETNLYYLNSRYYDPEIGRFIYADEPRMLFLNATMPFGANLFAYCHNNPVMYTGKTSPTKGSPLFFLAHRQYASGQRRIISVLSSASCSSSLPSAEAAIWCANQHHKVHFNSRGVVCKYQRFQTSSPSKLIRSTMCDCLSQDCR